MDPIALLVVLVLSVVLFYLCWLNAGAEPAPPGAHGDIHGHGGAHDHAGEPSPPAGH